MKQTKLFDRLDVSPEELTALFIEQLKSEGFKLRPTTNLCLTLNELLIPPWTMTIKDNHILITQDIQENDHEE